MESDFTQQELFQALTSSSVPEVVEIINSADVDVNCRDVTHDLQTFLMRLCYVPMDITSTSRILSALLAKSDVNLSVQDAWGRTVLMHACIANKPMIVEALLESPGVGVDIRDFEGNSALSYAVQNCDIYTIEDLLQQPSGSNVLSVPNSKGQSPYSIAEKSGDKRLLSLLASFANKSVCLQQRRRQRKPGGRAVTSLPPAYSPSPERSPGQYSSPRHRTEPIHLAHDFSKLELHCGEPSGKSESAPLIRRSITVDASADQSKPSLSLTSARLSRSNHKQDSLASARFLLNPSSALPAIGNTPGSDWTPASVRTKRRGSISLPDLRDTGCLVTSGQNTPAGFQPHSSSEEEEEGSDDNVFAHSYPSARTLRVDSDSKASLGSRQRGKQLTLPEINSSYPNLSSPQLINKNLSTLAKAKKYSSSDELQRMVLLKHTS